MKRNVILLAVVCGFSLLRAQSTSIVDTLYYDKEWKGVMGIEFANYYRVTNTPKDPNFPKKFKDYNVRENYLYAEGDFISIDRYDDSKSIFTNLYTRYSSSGQVMAMINYKSGMLNGLCTTYYPNGNIESEIMYINDTISGKYVTYTNKGGIIYNGIMNGDVFSGEYNEYDEDGFLESTSRYKLNILEGTLTMYYPSGYVYATFPYKDGLLDGILKVYNESGIVVEERSYKRGLKCGIHETRDGSNTQRSTYKAIVPSDGVFGLSVKLEKKAYDIYGDKNRKTIGGEKICGGGWLDSYYHFIEIGLFFMNASDKTINGSIENVKVEFIKEDKVSKNMVISEITAIDIYKDYAEKKSKLAYWRAEATANAAATQSVQSTYSGQGSSVSVAESSTNTSQKSSAVGIVQGAVVGVNNSGYVGVGAAGAAAKSEKNSSSNTSSQAYSANGSSQKSQSSEVYVDGQLRYQVYQQEKEKADKISEEANEFASKKIEENKYSEFEIPAYSSVDKTILVSDSKKKFETIKFSFDFNGVTYSVVW